MTSELDSYVSFASASFRTAESSSAETALTDEEHSDAAAISHLSEEPLDLSTEMVPTFFESGQLMWEISARTEQMSLEDEQPIIRPEIVLTDSSFLSISAYPDDQHRVNNCHKDFETAKHTQTSRERIYDEHRYRVHSERRHCFELLTDENRPLGSRSNSVTVREAFKDIPSRSGSPDMSPQNLSSSDASVSENVCHMPSPFQSRDCPVHLAMNEAKWMESNKARRGQGNKGRKQRIAAGKTKDYETPTSPMSRVLSSTNPLSSKKTDTLPAVDSAFDIFRTYDPRFVIGDDDSDLDDPFRSPMKPPKLSQMSLQKGQVLEHSSSAPAWSRQLSAPNRKGKCTFKEAISSALSKVFYNCTHTKQRRKEKQLLKRMQTFSKDNMTPSSSSCGAYRRRNTLICQKMEGMINNEPSPRTAKTPARSENSSTGKIRKPESEYPPVNRGIQV